MGVTSVKEIWEGGRPGTYNRLAERTYERVFRVVTNNAFDDAIIAGSAIDPSDGTHIPRIFDAYVTLAGTLDIGARCVSVEPQQDQDDPNTWRVVAKYSSMIGFARNFGRRNDSAEQARDGSAQQNPLLRPTVIKWGTQKFQKPIHWDLDTTKSKPVVNSAGQFFDPPIEIDDSRIHVTFSRNESFFDSARLAAYKDAVNSKSFFGYAKDTVKVDSIEAESAYENGVFYAKVIYSFHVRTETVSITTTAGTNPVSGWAIDEYPIDRGYYEIDSLTGFPLSIMDAVGSYPPGPKPLDGKGELLAFTEAKKYLIALPFTFYVRKDLNDLGLP